MVNHKEGVNTELQGKCPRGRPHSKWEPLVRKDVLQNYGRRTEMEEKELWKDRKMEQLGCGNYLYKVETSVQFGQKPRRKSSGKTGGCSNLVVRVTCTKWERL